MSHVTNLNPPDFDAAIDGGTPVLVDFHARWCAPCRALAPTLERVAGARAGQVRFHAVDVDAAPELARRFDVRSVPTLVLFKPGEPPLHIHARSVDGLLSAIDQHIASPLASAS